MPTVGATGAVFACTTIVDEVDVQAIPSKAEYQIVQLPAAVGVPLIVRVSPSNTRPVGIVLTL